MNNIEKAYLAVIFEENYSDDNWIKHGSYHGIDFYIRTDGHLKKRLNERYSKTNKDADLANAFIIVKRFIKEELKESTSILMNKSRDEFSFTIFGTLTKMYVSGRFKMNKETWRCYIATVLPPSDVHYNKNDVYKSVKA